MSKETSSHPVVQELVKIEDLISQKADTNTILQAVTAYSENLTKPGFLNEAEKGVVALARKRIEEILTKHEQFLFIEKKGRPIRSELVKAKVKLAEHPEVTPGTPAIAPIQEAPSKPKVQLAVVPPETATPEPVLKKRIEKAPENEKPFFKAVETYLQNKPEETKLFTDTLQLLEIESIDSRFADLQDRVKKLFEMIKTRSDPEKWIEDFFNSGLKPLQNEINKALETSEDREFYLHVNRGKIAKEMSRLYAILVIDPNDIKDLKKRRYFIEIQNDVRESLALIKYKSPPDSFKSMTLKERGEVLDAISKSQFEPLKESIDYFETEILPHLPDKTQLLYKGEGVKKAGATPSEIPPVVEGGLEAKLTEELGAGAATAEIEPTGAIPLTKPKAAEERETGRTLELSEDVRELLETLLEKKEMVRDDDAVCLAINTLIQKREPDLNQLKQFLQNPKFLNDTIPQEAKDKVKAEMAKKNASSYDKLKIALTEERESIDEFLQLVRGRRPTVEEEKKTTTILERKIEINRLLKVVDVLNGLEKRTMTYESPREILNLINFYTRKDEPKLKMEDLASEIENQIDEQRKNLYKGSRALLNRICCFLRPSLKSTLKALAKDSEFSKLGENPEEVLAKLSQIGTYDNENNIKDWINKLPGDKSAHMETTVPRLIAYLELAIRDGKVSLLMDTRSARKLVGHLRKLQRDYIRKEVKDSDIDNQQKMLLYIQKLNEASRNTADISGKLLRKHLHVGRSEVKKLLGGAGIAAAGLMSPFALIGLLSTALFAASYTKRIPEKNKPMVRKVGTRIFAANALAFGGTLAGLTSLWVPVAAGAGIVVLPLIGKMLWERRKAKKKA